MTNLQRALVLGVACACLSLLGAPAGQARASAAATIPDLTIDFGVQADADASAPAYLSEAAGLSAPTVEDGRTVRTLRPGSTVALAFRADQVPLSAEGVPFRDALLETEYRDTVDETDCATLESTRTYCRPRLETRLDYGLDRLLTWWQIGAVAGLADGQWKVGREFLEGTSWQTLRAIDGVFQLRLHFPGQPSGGHPLPVDSITMRFPDRTEFLALREADRAARGLTRIDFTETASPPQAAGSAFALFARPILDKVYANSVPRPSEVLADGEGLHAFEVAGEREAVSLSIYAYRDLGQVTVEAGDLLAASGQGRIPAADVTVAPVGIVDKRWAYSYDARYGANPWVLLDPDPVDVPSGTSQQFWITVEVPKDSVPGTYSGLLHVAAADAPARDVPLEMDVYALDLAPPDATPYVYHSPYLPGKYFSQRFETTLEDMAHHQVNPIIYLDAEISLDDLHVDMRDLGRELGDLQVLGLLPPEPRVGVFDNARSLWGKLCPGADLYTVRCAAFDQAYVQVLTAYKEAFERYGGAPALSFADEPGNDPDRRMLSNYLNRLARLAGMRTWVTYYPACEQALAGHELEFEDARAISGSGSPETPRWLLEDEHLKGLWDFTYGTDDRTDYGNRGQLAGSATVSDGLLMLPDENAYMRIADADWLDLGTQATFGLWLRVDACPRSYASHPLAKWNSTDDANYVLYLFGDMGGVYPENLGMLRVYANVGGQWSAVSGGIPIDCSGGLGSWHQVVWTYDATAGGTLWLDGSMVAANAHGRLAANTAPLVVGQVTGAIDDVIVLDRALSTGELVRLAKEQNPDYDRAQTVTLSATAPAGAPLPQRLAVSLEDLEQAPEELETTKELLVNGQVAWSARSLAGGARIYPVEVGALLRDGGPNEIAFRVTNGDARREHLRVYFADYSVRLLSWTTQVDAAGHWKDSEVADPSGALGPMDPELDDRVYAMSLVTGDEITRTHEAGDTFSYYTTYPATQPALVNNRFLNGLYASALGARGVYVYAYGDWGSQPWDDMGASFLSRLDSPTSLRSQNNYELVLPAWDDRMYDTVVYEVLREGVEDSRVIATLRREIAGHPGPLAAEAAAYLADVLGRVTPDYRSRYMYLDASRPVEQLADRGGQMLTDLAGAPDAYGFFDQTRLQMLRYAMALGAQSRLYLPVVGRR